MVDAMLKFCAAFVFNGVAVVAQSEITVVAVLHDGVHGAFAGVALVAGFVDVVAHDDSPCLGFTNLFYVDDYSITY